MLDVKEEDLAVIREILKKRVPGAVAIAFGSRVAGTAVPQSDLDLALKADGRLDFAVLGNIKMDFEESVLPFRVDVLDWASLSPEFKKIIESHREII
ncbi:MAG: nucleotidyltransferase domain-containing protein [Elusimicrobia bacterium]|nr:nucleotidyltransferase domain-containing protein [Elusimicrobiota bacterium]